MKLKKRSNGYMRGGLCALLLFLLSFTVYTPLDAGLDGDGVVVAIIGTGVDYTHPQLTERLWVDPAEDRNCNGKLDLPPDLESASFPGLSNYI